MPDTNTYTPSNWLSRASSTERASSAEKVKARVVVQSWDLSAPRASEGEGGKASNATTGSNWLDMGRSRPASTLAIATPRSLACSRQSDRHDTQNTRTYSTESIQPKSFYAKQSRHENICICLGACFSVGGFSGQQKGGECLPSFTSTYQYLNCIFVDSRVPTESVR